MNSGGNGKRSGAPALRWLLCDCEGSQKLDAEALTEAFRLALGDKVAPESARSFCSLCADQRAELDVALAEARAEGRPIGVACAQEAEFFFELDEEIVADAAEAAAQANGKAVADAAPFDAPGLLTVDIRDRAGWSRAALADPAAAAPKIAALLAEAALPPRRSKTLEVVSDGVCLIIGRAAVALPAAERLADRLSVTALLTDPENGEIDAAAALSPRPGLASGKSDFDIVAGRVRKAVGALGGFILQIDRFAERRPGGRGGLSFAERRDGAQSECDLIVDLTGDQAMFPAPEKRDGYLRADPKDPLAVERALFNASELSGEFDKTLHIAFEASLCAHSRARKPGCDRCLSVCPTGAITVAASGDSVEIDPNICAGCGACAAVCPSGAARYDAPGFERQTLRLRTLIEAYRAAAPSRPGPRLLIHDAEHGAEMIRLAARYGDGLPVDVVPLGLGEVTEAGHALLLAAFGLGYRSISLLAGPKTERVALEAQIALTRRMLEACALAPERLALLDPADPDGLCETLYAEEAEPLDRPNVLALGEPRTVTRQALAALSPEAGAVIDLSPPQEADAPWPAGGAPYGAVVVNQSACTLCLACVSLCPSGALGDNPDRPELRFQEDACLQCGICEATCPEGAISYEPRFNLAQEALVFKTVHSEEPFACVECGAKFGVKSTIERIAEKLGGKHWMYTGSDNLKLIQMCDDCRVKAQFHVGSAPFKMGTPRKVRTTQDYLDERAAEEAAQKRNGAQKGDS